MFFNSNKVYYCTNIFFHKINLFYQSHITHIDRYGLKHFVKCFYTKARVLNKGLDPNWGTKHHLNKRNVKIGLEYKALINEDEQNRIDKQLEPLRIKIKAQGNLVRNLKSSNASKDEIHQAVSILKAYKKDLEAMIMKLMPGDSFDKARMMDLIKRKFFYDVSFSVYGGMSGQYDYGPMGSEIVDNILTEWNKHFVIQERMLKIKCSSISPTNALKASGHIDKFTDLVTKDSKGDFVRVDHWIKQELEEKLLREKICPEERSNIFTTISSLNSMSKGELETVIKDYNLKEGEETVEISETNLMFPLSIGPSGSLKGFLRPETSQGVFLNFKKLVDYNHGKLPFACAQVGNAFRNEISPKSSLLRVREFTLAEIEHFCYPDDKTHPKFDQVSSTKLWLYSAQNQVQAQSPKLISIGEAVTQGLVQSETLGYYMARIQQFLLNIGIKREKLRFRQHLRDEMAHYAQDCWDGECLTSYGWVECVGCADRSAYDLTQHSKATGLNLGLERPLAEPRVEERPLLVMDRKEIKKEFHEEAENVFEILNSMELEEAMHLEKNLRLHGKCLLKSNQKVTREMIPEVKTEMREVFTEKVIPSVIEPSFGVGRIFYALLEHSFKVRPDEKRTFFSLPPSVAPIKVAILPLVHKEEFKPFVQILADAITDENLRVWIEDTKGSVGRRYVRMDEISVPFCVTVDEETLASSPPTVTLRERDSMLQVRVSVEEVARLVQQLSCSKLKWEDVLATRPRYSSSGSLEDSEEEAKRKVS